jgi:hypothetical protein
MKSTFLVFSFLTLSMPLSIPTPTSAKASTVRITVSGGKLTHAIEIRSPRLADTASLYFLRKRILSIFCAPLQTGSDLFTSTWSKEGHRQLL